jgi:hypothetical protein
MRDAHGLKLVPDAALADAPQFDVGDRRHDVRDGASDR